jgi:citrate lyase beta subunit
VSACLGRGQTCRRLLELLVEVSTGVLGPSRHARISTVAASLSMPAIALALGTGLQTHTSLCHTLRSQAALRARGTGTDPAYTSMPEQKRVHHMQHVSLTRPQ